MMPKLFDGDIPEFEGQRFTYVGVLNGYRPYDRQLCRFHETPSVETHDEARQIVRKLNEIGG